MGRNGRGSGEMSSHTSMSHEMIWANNVNRMRDAIKTCRSQLERCDSRVIFRISLLWSHDSLDVVVRKREGGASTVVLAKLSTSCHRTEFPEALRRSAGLLPSRESRSNDLFSGTTGAHTFAAGAGPQPELFP